MVCYICKKIFFTFVKLLVGEFENRERMHPLFLMIILYKFILDNMELIKDRLSHILRAKNLTATQFAEMMQIQPSNVSHLLSGRNKPSLDFLIKLKEVFPEYNYEWIILGKKPITTNDSTLFHKENIVNAVETNQFDDSLDVKNDDEMISMPKMEFADNHFDTPIHKSITESLSNKLKQIIYVYEDRTVEVYDVRK